MQAALSAELHRHADRAEATDDAKDRDAPSSRQGDEADGHVRPGDEQKDHRVVEPLHDHPRPWRVGETVVGGRRPEDGQQAAEVDAGRGPAGSTVGDEDEHDPRREAGEEGHRVHPAAPRWPRFEVSCPHRHSGDSRRPIVRFRVGRVGCGVFRHIRQTFHAPETVRSHNVGLMKIVSAVITARRPPGAPADAATWSAFCRHATAERGTQARAGPLPSTTAAMTPRTSSPYCSSLAGPTPLTPARSSSVSGRALAMAARVLSSNTT